MSATGVRYIPLHIEGRAARSRLPLAAAWVRGLHDPIREEMLAALKAGLAAYAAEA